MLKIDASAIAMPRHPILATKKVGGKALALPPPCPWVVLKVKQSYETRLLQELGHFLLHAVSLR